MSKKFDRGKWLEERRKGIGSSDAAAIMGISPWKTAAHVVMEKLQGVETVEETDLTRLGQLLEDDILQLYQEREGKKPRRVNKILHHKQYDFICASLDAMVPVMTPLEVKMIVMAISAREFGKEGTDEIPDHYLIQTQHQMAVTGAELVEVPVLIYGKLRLYRVRRNERLITQIVDTERAFWQDHIIDQKPVAFDFEHPQTLGLIENLYGIEPGKSIDLDAEALAIATEYEHYANLKSFEQDQQKACKAKLLALMGEAELARLPDGRYMTRKTVERKAYSVAACEYVDFRIKQFKQRIKT